MMTHATDSTASATVPAPSDARDSDSATQLLTPTSPVDKREKITSALIYQVDSVEKTEAPGGGEGQDWYRYVLKNRSSTIDGLRRGSRQLVCAYAAEYAEQLNSRILYGPPRWQPRNSKAARTT